MEKIDNTLNEWLNIDYMRNRIYETIQDYISNPIHEIDNGLSKASQQQFDGVLNYVGRTLFKNNPIMRYQNIQQPNIYNIDVIESIGYIYLELCQLYNKISSVYSFSFISTIEYDSLLEWLNDNSNRYSRDTELNRRRSRLIKNIHNNREFSLKNKLTSTNQALGYITIGNVEYGWSSETIAKEERAKATALNELPTLDKRPIIDSQNGSNMRIDIKDV